MPAFQHSMSLAHIDEADLVALLCAQRAATPSRRALLVGLSGIDGAGKGWVARRLATRLEGAGLRVASLGVDLWLNLPAVRFSADRPGEHFYANALRLEELLAHAALPLRNARHLDLTFDATEETATTYRQQRWRFDGVDVVLLEGIFLFKRGLRRHYDVAVWLDCSFETALQRAIARGQEGFPVEETIRAYETVYFPAQRIHLQRDDPRGSADLVLPNDPRLLSASPQPSPGAAAPATADSGSP